jgi:hypothetical protein
MTSLHRVVLAWSGAPIVGAAVTVLHFDGSNQSAPPVAAIKTAFQGAVSLFNGNVTITVPNSGDTIDDRTGALTGVWSGTGGGSVTGNNAGMPMAGVGACIGWTTGGIVTGLHGPRKLRGRTFIVPLSNTVVDADGTLTSGALTQLQTLANALQASGPLAIWHRPTSLAAANGNSYGVLSNRVRDKLAFLSSRRD